jgi:hypothetical protein
MTASVVQRTERRFALGVRYTASLFPPMAVDTPMRQAHREVRAMNATLDQQSFSTE